MFSRAWTTAGLLDALSTLNAVVCDDSGCIWSIQTRLLIIAHSSLTAVLSFSFRKTFLYLNAMPCINCSLILRCISSVRSLPASSLSTTARFASRCLSVIKLSGCSFMGSNFRDCRSSSKFLLWSAPA